MLPDGRQKPLDSPRDKLKKRVFRGCDKDEDGYLNREEMMTLAVLTGFDGSDQTWHYEYERLCLECKADYHVGIGRTTLMRLMDDRSSSGFHCTDQQLHEFAAALTEDEE